MFLTRKIWTIFTFKLCTRKKFINEVASRNLLLISLVEQPVKILNFKLELESRIGDWQSTWLIVSTTFFRIWKVKTGNWIRVFFLTIDNCFDLNMVTKSDQRYVSSNNLIISKCAIFYIKQQRVTICFEWVNTNYNIRRSLRQNGNNINVFNRGREVWGINIVLNLDLQGNNARCVK